MFRLNPTRRSLAQLLAASPALGLALPPSTARAGSGISDAEFIRAFEGIATNGGLAARQALIAGWRPQELTAVIFSSPGDKPERWPALLFRRGDEHATFRPAGRD